MSKTVSNETKFMKWLLENIPSLNSDRIDRIGSGERNSHVRFRKDSGLNTIEELKAQLDLLKIPYTNCDEYTGSPLYKGHGINILWNNSTIGVLVAIADNGKIERKRYTPQSLGLAGLTFDNIDNFKEKIIKGILKIENNVNISDCLISMLDNITSNGTISIIDCKFLHDNINKITSDFGEILAAYYSVHRGNTINFPIKSNNNIADYSENNIPVSAKGRLAGGKVNLGEFNKLIPQDNLIGKFLHSLAIHDRDLFFKFGAELCIEAKLLSTWVGGTTTNDVSRYVKNTSYEDFYDKIESLQEFKGLGIPLESKDTRPRELWKIGDTNPFYFTLNTIIHRLWGEKNSIGITDIVSKFLNKAKFIHVDIKNLSLEFEEVLFADVSLWTTEYHSRATKAWHNWMGIQAIKEKND